MPVEVTVTVDPKLAAIGTAIESLPRWLPAIFREHLPVLGQRLVEIMQAEIEPHNYTGELSDSIVSEYTDEDYSVSIYPTALRGGKYDGGSILELGTAPIPRLPWAPIKAWADFRGIPAFPVWYAIRERGVQAHPFLERTLAAGDSVIGETTRRIGEMVTDAIVTGTGKESV